MNLDHLNLCASDVGSLSTTLQRHFGYQLVQAGSTPAADGGGAEREFAFLLGSDGSSVVITQIDAQPDGPSSYPPGFHFGLMQDSAQAVHAKHAELDAAGYHPGPVSDGFEVFGATWTAFYCPLGDGLEIEINHRTPSPVLDQHH